MRKSASQDRQRQNKRKQKPLIVWMNIHKLWEKAEEDVKEASHIFAFCPKNEDNARRILNHIRSANAALQSLEQQLAGMPQPKVGE